MQGPADELLRLLEAHPSAATPDGELVERFALRGDAAAFAELVERHGGMVLGVCRRLLDHHDAEDAFQATFLVLARRAGSLRQAGQVGCWLYRVALRVARKTRAVEARRKARIQPLPDVAAPPAAEGMLSRELAQVLDEEVHRLPARYREPMVLCCFEGHSGEDAARQLGCAVGTIKSRLSRARDLLRDRLTRRGLAPLAGVAATLGPAVTSAAVPPALASSLMQTLLPGSAAPVATPAWTLAEKVVADMVRIKLAVLATLVLLTLTGVGLGLAVFLGPAPAIPEKPEGEKAQADPPEKTAKEDATKPPREPLPEGALARLGSARMRHNGPIGTAALSTDGKSLATFSADHLIHLWDVSSGREVAKLTPEVANPVVKHLALSAGAGLLAWSGNSKEGVRLVDSVTGKELRVLHATQNLKRDGAAPLMAFDPDGKEVATWAGDGTLRLWDVATGKELRQWGIDEASHLAFSPDGRTVAAAGKDGFTLFPVHRQDDPRTVAQGEAPLALAFTLDGKTLATGHKKGVILWDVATGKRRAGAPLGDSPVMALGFSPDGKAVHALSRNGTVSVCESASGRVQRSFKLPLPSDTPVEVSWATFSLDCQTLLWWTSAGQVVRVTHVSSGEEMYGGESPGTWGFGYSPDGRLLATTGEGRILIWDATTGRIVRRCQEVASPIHWVSFTPDGNKLVAIEFHQALAANRISVWDAQTGKRLSRADAEVRANGTELSPEGRRLAVGEAVWGSGEPRPYDAAVILDVTTGKVIGRSEDRQKQGVGVVTWSPDGKQVASLGHDSLVRAVEALNGKSVLELSTEAIGGQPINLRYAEDSKTLFLLVQTFQKGVGITGTKVVAWDSVRGKLKQEWRGPRGWFNLPVFSRDAKLLAWGTQEGEVHVWDVTEERNQVSFQQRGCPSWMAFSPDRKTLASLDTDGTILVWDLATAVKK